MVDPLNDNEIGVAGLFADNDRRNGVRAALRGFNLQFLRDELLVLEPKCDARA